MTPPTTPPAGLDFASIRQQYPTAFAALTAWFCAGRYTVMGVPDVNAPTQEEYDYGPWLNVGPNLFEFGDYKYGYALAIRDLFDFFDQQGVWVTIENSGSRNTERIFFGRIEVNGRFYGVGGKAYPTRTAAESVAFMAAFGKLEEMLKQKQG